MARTPRARAGVAALVATVWRAAILAAAHRTRRLRHLHLHLEEPMGGVRGAHPRRIRQVRLAHHRTHAHFAIDVECPNKLSLNLRSILLELLHKVSCRFTAHVGGLLYDV